MITSRIQSPSRLHFGLLSWGPDAPRQFGGVGLMIDRPGLRLSAAPAAEWATSGPHAERAFDFAHEVASALEEERGEAVPPLRITVEHAPPEHVGLGLGTQLSLAVARLIAHSIGRSDVSLADFAAWTGRGLRSGIGLHGFVHGGLIVDGGRRGEEGIPPLLGRYELPADWHVLVLIPPGTSGLNGPDELEAFSALPPMSDAVSDRLCRLVLLGLLPAVVERDIVAFGSALTAIQFHVGRCFAPVQGGLYGRSDLGPIVDALRRIGLHGAGQSSWGPALYAFSNDRDPERREAIRESTRERFGLGPEAAFWAQASPTGAVLTDL